jgi:hypothetical protein
MKDRSMRNSPISMQTLAYALTFAGFCGFGAMALANEGADKPAVSSASLSSICEAYNKALAAEGGTEAKATAAATEAGGGDLLKDGPQKLKAACLTLGVPLQALNAEGGNSADMAAAERAIDKVAAAARDAGGKQGGGDDKPKIMQDQEANEERARELAREAAKGKMAPEFANALEGNLRNKHGSAVGDAFKEEFNGGVRTGSTGGFRSEAVENSSYNHNLNLAENTLKQAGLDDAVVARQGLAEKFGEGSAQVAGFDEGIRQATKNTNTQGDGSMGLARTDASQGQPASDNFFDKRVGADALTQDASLNLSQEQRQTLAQRLTLDKDPVATGNLGAQPARFGSATEDEDKRVPQAQGTMGQGRAAEIAERNGESRLVDAPQPPARPANLATPQKDWSGGNLPYEQQNSREFQRLNSYFAKNGDEETAKIFAESKNMNELTRRLGAREGDFSAAELNAIPANQRQNYLESGLGMPQGSLAPSIVQAAQAGKLTDAQLNAIYELPKDGTAGPAISKILASKPDTILDPLTRQRIPTGGGGNTPPQAGATRINPSTGQPEAFDGRQWQATGQGKNDPLSQALQQMSRGFGQQGQGGNQFGNPSNQFGNQFGQQCPFGTQQAFINGQQACISTGQGQGQCPVGFTAAYNNTNTFSQGFVSGLTGVNTLGGSQLTCVPTGTAGNTCPVGQVPSVQANGITVCVTQTATNEASVREQAGYLDGVRVKDGVCGLGIDSRFSTDSNYLAGYNRGQAECRAGSGTGTGTGTTVTKTNPNRDVSDARARAICQEQIGNVSKELKDTKGLFTLLFRERGALSEAEKTALGFDETIEKRLTAAKNQFDAGKADAVSIRDLDSDRKDNVSYREGYACGRKML